MASARDDVVTTLRAAGCVFAEDEADLLIAGATSADGLSAMVRRRAEGLPLEQILGWAEFCGLRVVVEPGVFVPRRRTGLLVSEGAARARRLGRRALVVDLCCGSGALGAALLAELGEAEVHAADVDPAAVRCARRNLGPPDGHVHEGDLYDALPPELRGRVDVLVANTPYVPTGAIGTMPPEARLHEPRVALDGGPDGLDVQRRVAAGAPAWLAPGGHLLVETSERQAAGSVAIFEAAGLVTMVVRSDELDAVAVIGTRPGTPR